MDNRWTDCPTGLWLQQLQLRFLWGFQDMKLGAGRPWAPSSSAPAVTLQGWAEGGLAGCEVGVKECTSQTAPALLCQPRCPPRHSPVPDSLPH